jgi:two-component system sensor histidine kinase PilS (NtrC family)
LSVNSPPVRSDDDFYEKLKWLMFFRVLFTVLLLGSTAVLHWGGQIAHLTTPLLVLYELIAALFLLSFVYSLLLPRLRRTVLFAFVQIAIDTVVVTLVIFLTGSFSSLFAFLYLVVIIYASMLLFRGGSMVVAALCGIQYGILVNLEFYGILEPFAMEEGMTAADHPWSFVLYKVTTIIVACFAVAFLSGLLAEQNRRTRKELRAMESHVKRVERMAVVGEMAAGLAHEIKNPLASLTGSIQLLQDELPLEPQHEKLMRIVRREADRLSSLVTDFLMFARPPAGAPRDLNLSHAVGEIVDLFEREGGKTAEIRLRRDISANQWVRMDPDHLRQVLWNLLRNAAEAIAGPGDISIRLSPGRDGHAVVRISDTGCGIPEPVMPTIFDPFVTTKPHGTGLGLSIVHRIVESAGGRLDIESREGEGTIVRLRLKRSEPDDIPEFADGERGVPHPADEFQRPI